MSWDDLLHAPIRRFWFLLNQIDRLRSDAAIEQLHLMASVGSAEAYKSAIDHLKQEIGQVYVWETPVTSIVVENESELDPEFDRAGLAALKARLSGGR